MRKLMWCGIGFAAACFLGIYVLSGVWPLIFGICVLLAAVGGILLSPKVSHGRRVSLLALGLALGLVWFYIFSTFTLAEARRADGEKLEIFAEVTDYSYATKYGVAVQAEICLEGKTYGGRLYLNEQLSLSPGDRVEGEFELRYTGPEGEERSDYYSGTGIYLIAYQKGETTVQEMHDRSIRHFPARLRSQILQKLDGMFPADTAAFAKALLLGDRTDLDHKTTTALTASGIIHLVAVSGLHVSVLFSLLYFVLGRHRVLTPLVGTAVLIFVAAVTGFSVSVVRACLMNWLMVMALVVNKEADSPTALSFAVVVMLSVNPLSVTSVGLQLSVASVIGLIVFSEPISDWVRQLPFWAEARRRTLLAYIRNTVAASVGSAIGASIATAPLTALHFGTVSLVGLLTNLLTVSVANLVFVLLIFAVALGFVWLPAGSGLAWLLSWPIRYILQVAVLLSSVPFATAYTRSVYVTWWLVFAYAALLVFYLRGCKELWQLCVSVTVTVAVALGLSWLEPRLEEFRVTVVDVGQGQCVLLQSEGKTYMVDCGGEWDKAAADAALTELFSQGVFQLDGLILTHYDSDHVGGVPYVLDRIPVETVYLPVGPGGEEWQDAIHSGSQEHTVSVETTTELSWDGALLTIFSSEYQETSNESSLCVLFQKENYDILITGDRTWAGEADLLLKHDIPQLDALVAGHHGSTSSTSEYLLSRTRPATVLISAGQGNRYGHPTAELLERLETYGCTVRRTDIEGTIIIRR